MLESFLLTKTGFNESLKINDVVSFEDEEWIIRAIANNRITSRYVKGFSGYNRQYDVIEAIVVAQKIGTFDIANACTNHTTIVSTCNTAEFTSSDRFNNKKPLAKIGDVRACGGQLYIVTSVNEISYSFIDIVVKSEATSVTELKPTETKKMRNQRKLNDLGWEVRSVRF